MKNTPLIAGRNSGPLGTDVWTTHLYLGKYNTNKYKSRFGISRYLKNRINESSDFPQWQMGLLFRDPLTPRAPGPVPSRPVRDTALRFPCFKATEKLPDCGLMGREILKQWIHYLFIWNNSSSQDSLLLARAQTKINVVTLGDFLAFLLGWHINSGEGQESESAVEHRVPHFGTKWHRKVIRAGSSAQGERVCSSRLQ